MSRRSRLRSSEWLVGLDLGQRQDPSALLVVERRPIAQDYVDDAHAVTDVEYAVRWGKRWPLGTEYGAVVQAVDTILASPALAGRDTTLLVDATGVGAPVVEMIRRWGMSPVPVLVTSGAKATQDDGGWWHVPKAHLASTLALVVEQGRLRIAKALDVADQLRNEMRTFRIRKTAAGNDTFEAARQADHDDLVFALSLALWWGEIRRRHRTQPELHTGPLAYTDPLLLAGY